MRNRRGAAQSEVMEGGGGGHDDTQFLWLISFSDMMTNLMLFFLTLYGLTQVAAAHRASVLKSLQTKFGGESSLAEEAGRPAVPDLTSGELERAKARAEQAREAQAGLERLIRKKNLSAVAQVGVGEQRVKLTLADPVLFDSGRADLKAGAYPVLHELAGLLNASPGYHAIVEGHADANPIHRGGRTYANWELSAGRAFNVIRALIEREGVSPSRLSAVGYGEFRPVATNATAEGRVKNRRIEITLAARAEAERRPAPAGGLSGPPAINRVGAASWPPGVP